jgi:uncharacterized membrane protein HdeD (DUF308 family)
MQMNKIKKGDTFMAKKSNSNVSSALLYIVIGILLIVFRSQTLNWAMTAIGAFFVISGILDIAKKNTFGGFVSLVIGIAILVLGWTAAHIVLLVLGVLMAVKGVLALLQTLTRKTTLFGILFPVLTIVAGLSLAFGNGLDVVLVVAGVILVVDGFFGLASKK